MKRIIKVLIVTTLSVVLISTAAYAKGKPSWAGSGNSQSHNNTTVTTQNETIDQTDEGSNTENDEQNTETGEKKGYLYNKKNATQNKKVIQNKYKIQIINQAKNKGQAKKLEDRIRVRGMNLKFDVPPVIKEGRTLIPVRAIMNGLGAKVDWNAETKVIIITRGGKVVVLNLETQTATVNGEEIQLDVPAQIMSNRTFVPLRFVAKSLGDNVNYDEETGEIDIGDDTNSEDATDEENTSDGTNSEDATDEENTSDDTNSEDATDEENTSDDTNSEDATDEENASDDTNSEDATGEDNTPDETNSEDTTDEENASESTDNNTTEGTMI